MPGASIDEGVYNARITSWWLGESKEKHTPYVAFQCALVNEIQGDTVVSCPPYERTVYRHITDKTIDYVAQDLERLGYDREGFDALDPEHPNHFDFAGKEVRLRCEHEEYNGDMKERWSFAWGGAGAPAAKLERKEVSRLNALYAKHLKNAVPGKPPEKPRIHQAPQAAPANSEDEIPF